MSLQILFWILMLFWLLTGFYTPAWPHWTTARNLLLFLLLLVLGWAQFGTPIKG